MAEAVEEDCRCPAPEPDAVALAPGDGVLDRGREQRGGLGLAALVGREQHSAVRGHAHASRGGDRISLCDHRTRFTEIAAPGEDDPLALQRGRELRDRSGVTGQLQLPSDDRVPANYVPQRGGGPRGPSPELKHLLITAKRAHRLPERRRRRSESLRDQLREAVQEKVGSKRLVRRRRSGADSARDIAQCAGARKLARSQSGAQGLEIGLTREVDIEQLELLRFAQQL